MEELNNKEENKIPKKLIIIIVIIVSTALIAGSLVYFWLKTRIAQEKESLEVKLENSQAQFDQTYEQYQELITQKEEQDPYKDWQTYQNEEWGYEVKYPDEWAVYYSSREEPPYYIPLKAQSYFYPLKDGSAHSISIEASDSKWEYILSAFNIENTPYKRLTIDNHEAIQVEHLLQGKINIRIAINGPKSIVYELRTEKEQPFLDVFNLMLSTFKFIELIDTSNWQTYRNDEYGFEFEYSRNLILDDYDEESVGKVCYGCWKKTVVLKNEKENYSIYFNIYTNDNYDLCKSQLYNEHDLNEIGRGEYKVVSTENKLFLFSKSIELENIFKDGELNCIQSQCQQIQDLVTSVHLSASDLDDFVLRNSDDVIQQANQILSTFKLIDPVDTSTWQTYRNEEAGFTLEYPKEWGLIEKETYRKSIPPAPGEVFYIIFESNFSISGVTENYEPYESPLSVYTGGNPYKFCQDFNKEVFPLENCRKINDNISILTYGYYEEQGMFGTGEEIRFYIDAFIDNKLNKYKGITISYEFPEYFNNELVNMDINEIKNIAEKHSDQLNENSLSKFNQAITTFKFIE